MHAFDLSIPDGYFVETEHEARQWIQRFLRTSKPDMNNGLGLDSETTGLVKHKDYVVIWSLSDGQERICLPSKFIELFKEPILENPEICFDITNAKYDAHMFANSGADISKAGDWRDTVPQSWLINENNQGRHGLKDCIRDHFGRVTPEFEEIFGKLPPKKRGQEMIEKTTGDLINEAMADLQRRQAAADYASLDSYNHTKIRHHFDSMLSQIQIDRYATGGMTLKDFYYRICVPFTKVLWKMERRGFTVDLGYLRSLQYPMEQEMLEIEKEFARGAGRVLNLNSPKQLQWFFFEYLGKKPIKFTKGGASGNKSASTAADVLEEWAGEGDPWAQLLLRHRGISKIYGTYVMGLMEHVDPRYRVHTSLNQSGTVTGRLSSSDPNLQNMPRASEDVYRIREAFVPGAGKVLIVADYAQLEMRLMAHFSQDPKMINAIRNGIDLHCLTVSEMNGIPYDTIIGAVKKEKALKKAQSAGLEGEHLTEFEEQLLQMRQDAKSTGFGIIYGIGPPGLSAKLTRDSGGKRVVDEEEADHLIRKWFGVFPTVERFIDHTQNEMARTGYVQTICGRFRRFGDIRGMSRKDAGRAERQGVNSIVQGSAADIANSAMLQADSCQILAGLGAEMLLQVHDELIWECPDNPDTVKAVKARVQEIMEHPFREELLVPLPAEVGHGYSWADAK